jgi:hypothetical protein
VADRDSGENYQGEIGPAVFMQLSAQNRYSKEGKLLCLVVMTTAEKASADWRKAADELSMELDVPVELVVRDKLMEILSEGLMSNQQWEGPKH